MKRRAFLVLFLLSVLGVGSIKADGSVAPLDLDQLRETFLKEHRLFEKVYEGKSEWENPLCRGLYSYRILLKTQISDLDIQVRDDGSIYLTAELTEPYVGFQGNYQGLYSLCFPVENWSGLGAKKAYLEAEIYFQEANEGRVSVGVKVVSVRLDTLVTDGALSADFERRLTEIVNSGLTQVWSSHLGDWLNQKISFFLNQNIPIHL